MVILIQIIFFVIFVGISVDKVTIDAFQYEDFYDLQLEVEPRPYPSDLQISDTNKTSEELEMEDCMKELVICLKHSQGKMNQICAVKTETFPKEFDSICHMLYDNCKGYGDWHYAYEGNCRLSK